MQVVYIAAPYGAPTEEAIKRNIARAEALGREAIRQGHAPIVVHSNGAVLYGTDDTPGAREQVLEADCAIVRAVAGAGGEFWLLLTPELTTTSGCKREVKEWAKVTSCHIRVFVMDTNGVIEELL